jgi:hypothetical protein
MLIFDNDTINIGLLYYVSPEWYGRMMLVSALIVACLCQGLMAHPFYSWWNTPHDHYVYSENPNITEVLSQVNMDTPIVDFHTQFLAEYLQPRIEEVAIVLRGIVLGFCVAHNDHQLIYENPRLPQ